MATPTNLRWHSVNDDEDRPWIADASEGSEHEGFLIGNRAGLEALKAAVEQALATGEGIIQKPSLEKSGIDYIGVRVAESDPRIRRQSPPTFGGKLIGIGFLLLLGFLLLVFFLGLRALPTLFP